MKRSFLVIPFFLLAPIVAAGQVSHESAAEPPVIAVPTAESGPTILISQPEQSADLHAPVAAQDDHAPAGGEEHPACGHAAGGDFIMPHIRDADYIDIPWVNAEWMKAICLPHWKPVRIGGMEIDLSPTKHSVILMFSTLLCGLVLVTAARSHAKSARANKPPRGLANAIEAMVLYIRSEVIIPNIGHHGERFVPYLLTLFFFILFANLLGLFPYSATATSNIAVTATLAIVAFLVTEITGIRTLGWGYMKTMVFWPHDMPVAMKLPLTLIITPVEILGKLTKPFTLAIRLFANMTAGHVVILAMIGMIFTFGKWFLVPFPLGMAVAIMLLEILIGFIQAFVFTLLVSVFIGQMRESH